MQNNVQLQEVDQRGRECPWEMSSGNNNTHDSQELRDIHTGAGPIVQRSNVHV